MRRNSSNTGRVSIHAPARGATGKSYLPLGSIERFNPRPRAGGDHISSTAGLPHDVSIHAPARGATLMTRIQKLVPSSFNPRPRAGGDRSSSSRPGRHSMFQSTPPRGGRRWYSSGVPPRHYVSIHAPARGATKPTLADAACPMHVSIHAPARGATRAIAGCIDPSLSFQSTPPRGGRQYFSKPLKPNNENEQIRGWAHSGALWHIQLSKSLK